MKRTYLIAVIVLIVLALGGIFYFVKSKDKEIKPYDMETITLTTVDGVNLTADYYATASDKGVVLLHQFGKDRNSWGDFAHYLQVQGFSVVALDLRGHGDSDISHKLTDIDFNPGMKADLSTARQYLFDQGKTKQYIIGASIGANLAILDLANHSDDADVTGSVVSKPLKIVALSPGLDYHSLKTDEAIKEITGELAKGRERYGYGPDPIALLVVAGDDPSTTVNDVDRMSQALGKASEFIHFPSGGHGTDLLKNQPELEKQIVNFLNQ